MAAILGCVPAELNVSPAPGWLRPCGPNSSSCPKAPIFCSLLLSLPSFFLPISLSFVSLFNQQPCFPSPCAAGSKAEQCLEPSWFGNAHGSVGRNAQHRPAPSTRQSGRLDCKFQEFFCTLLSCLRLLAGCNPFCPPLLCQAFAGSDSLPCHRAASRRV